MNEKQSLNEKKEMLSKKLEEYSLAKENAKHERTKGFICTFAVGALLAGIISQTFPIIETLVATLGIWTFGAVGTIIYSHLQLPKKRNIKNLSKQISELESKHSEKVEIKEQTYSAHQDQEQVIMQITKPIISKYSKVNIDEFNK